MLPFRALVVTLLLAPLLAGCESIHYVVQAARGQHALSSRARPIPEVLKDEKTPPRVRTLLAEIPAIKRFGEANGLKSTTNYTTYVEVDSAPIWVVTACEPLAFKAKRWWFPIVGEASRLSWFDRKDADTCAAKLEAQGFDVYVRGAAAYSTAGWFQDAVYSSMLSDDDEGALEDLANAVLHESVHDTIFVPSQSNFIESVASFVASGLTSVYVAQARGANSPEKRYRDVTVQVDNIVEVSFGEAHDQLEALYASSKPREEMLAEKARIIAELRQRLHYEGTINNATLMGYRTYHVGKSDFRELFEACGESWPRMIAALKTLTSAAFSEPEQSDLGPVLLPLARNGCKAP